MQQKNQAVVTVCPPVCLFATCFQLQHNGPTLNKSSQFSNYSVRNVEICVMKSVCLVAVALPAARAGNPMLHLRAAGRVLAK